MKFIEEVSLDEQTVKELEKSYPDKQTRDEFVDKAVSDALSESGGSGR